VNDSQDVLRGDVRIRRKLKNCRHRTPPQT
jgi:hypothetical protein